MGDLAGKRVWVAGHRGMVGSALVRRLADEGCTLLTVGRAALDLTRQSEVEAWMAEHRPQVVFIAAARVGGIMANTDHPAEFLHQNLMIAANIIHAAHLTGVEKLLFIASSAVYPADAPQPFEVGSLMTGPFDPSHAGYSMAKMAGISMCQLYRRQYGCDFFAVLPTNLYGPGDNYDPHGSHVLPALLRKFHEAKMAGVEEITLWGTGTALRDFLHADDLADALVFLMRHYSGEAPVNIGSGSEVSIRTLAETIAEVVGYEAELVFDTTKPDGTARKLMDSSPLQDMGWNTLRSLRTGIAQTYDHWKMFLKEKEASDA